MAWRLTGALEFLSATTISKSLGVHHDPHEPLLDSRCFKLHPRHFYQKSGCRAGRMWHVGDRIRQRRHVPQAKVHQHHATAIKIKNPQLSQNMIDYSFAFLSSGSTRVILKWIENNFKESPEEMAKLIFDYTNCGIAALDKE